MFLNRIASNNIISQQTIYRIMIAVVAGHFLLLVISLTWSAVADWFKDDEVETITVQFYDPNLDNVVENPSTDPDPDNPIPPTGTQDGGAETPPVEEPQLPEPPVTEPPPPITPQPVTPVAQPQVTPRERPKPQPRVNPNLPPPTAAPSTPSVRQPRVAPREIPRSRQRQNTSSSQSRSSSSSSSSGNRSQSRGTNSEAGHTAPGGERGNSGYDTQVAIMIKRMWVTPDLSRLGGREPRVLIEIDIAPNGMVTRKVIRQRSGVLAMDESIEALLNSLRQVQKPFDGKKHTLTFWIKATD